MKVVALFLFMITHGATWAGDRGFSLRGTTLEKSNFNQVFKAVGLSKGIVLVDKNRYGNNINKFVCFITKDGMILEFRSPTLQGLAPGKSITEINMYTPGHENIRFDPKKCPRISLNSSRLKFRNRIGLNTKKKKVHSYLGTPMKKSGSRFFRSNKSVKDWFVVGLPKNRVFKGMEVHTFRESINKKLDETLTIRTGYDKDNRVNMISASKETTTDRGFSLKGIVLEESDFDHVFNAFKKAEKIIYSVGGSYTWDTVCFISKEGDFLTFMSERLPGRITRIHLTSSKKIVDGITSSKKIEGRPSYYDPSGLPVYRVPSHSIENHLRYDMCSRISLSSKDIKFKNGIGLLTKKEDVIKHLGKPLTKEEVARTRFFEKLNKGEFHYNFGRDIILYEDKEYYEALTIRPSYNSNNRVDKISVSKGTFH